MSHKHCVNLRIARGLATALLAGRWSKDDMAARLAMVLGIPQPKKWLRALVERILIQFGTDPPPPTFFRLTSFLTSDRSFGKVQQRLSDESAPRAASLNLLTLPHPQMAAAKGLRLVADIPGLTTTVELARWLEISGAELEWFADCRGRERFHPVCPLRHYRYLWMPKSTVRKRLLEVPKPRLKRIQRRILDEILNGLMPHAAAHAFRAGFSTVSCAAPHVGQRVVLRIDLCDFFPSVRSSRVQALFRTVGYPEIVARLLTGLCTNSVPRDVLAAASRCDFNTARLPFEVPHLPQGAPTSPALANLCCYRLDCRLAGLARVVGVNYTRYADDLIFSGDYQFERSLPRFRVLVCAIVLDEGFSIRRRKTRVMRSGCRQEVTGIVVNQHVNVPREEVDRLKAILHNCAQHGPNSQNREGSKSFREHLLGRVAHVAMIHPPRGARLRELFDQIEWPSASE